MLVLELCSVDEAPLLVWPDEAMLETMEEKGVVLALWLMEGVPRGVSVEEEPLEMAEEPGWLRTNKAPAAEKTTSRPKTRGTAVLFESI